MTVQISQIQELSSAAAKNIAIPVAASGATYMISVRVRTGFGYVSFKADTERAKIMKENGGKSSDTLPLFEAYVHGQDAVADELSSATDSATAPKRKSRKQMISIANSGTVLSTMIDKLQRHMICSGSERWWFFADNKIAEIQVGLEEAQAMLLVLLQELDDYHDDAFALYKRRLINILTRLNRLDELDGFLAKFPTREQIRESFRLEIEGPIRVPSAIELAREVNPEFKNWMSQLHQQIQRDVPKLVCEIFGEVADFLGRVEAADPLNLKPLQAEMLNKSYERVVSLQALYASMNQVKVSDDAVESILSRVMRIAQGFTNGRLNQDEMFSELVNYKSELRQVDQIASASSKGAKALATWSGIVTFEDRVKALKTEIAEFRKADLSDDDRVAQAAALQVKVRSMTDLLGAAAEQLLESVDFKSDKSIPVQQEIEAVTAEVTQPAIHYQVGEAGF